MDDEDISAIVIDRLLQALAAQLGASGELTAGAAGALADLSRAEAGVIFGQAGHLAHYGYEDLPLETLIRAITAVQRRDVPQDAPFKPGDEVRLVGELPEVFAGHHEALLREIVFVVRFAGRGPDLEIQSDLAEDWMIATVPITAVEHIAPGQDVF
ncbi:hypothetical protein Acy02nite_32550 [Actinoplanes cyaneus]|uniref:Uncharacterized protein n=1 Tax=Actinoplanes cyaneus TaxID=52696 RepID=A0A919M7G0_9ACTN|nr:hypothetical protein [Actinoplanes cyaneus]MCW2142567.1 hypothetical protein [Actinoplanes cyaneus]GID65374.1 hypothetical protein Acy02nite_32550 [Actinoplanes cyaneus]